MKTDPVNIWHSPWSFAPIQNTAHYSSLTPDQLQIVVAIALYCLDYIHVTYSYISKLQIIALLVLMVSLFRYKGYDSTFDLWFAHIIADTGSDIATSHAIKHRLHVKAWHRLVFASRVMPNNP